MEDTDRKYEPIKESRGWYFVEYRPPFQGNRYATLQLVIIEKVDLEKIVNVMEKEVKLWLTRYPIPVMVSSFNDLGDLNDLSKLKPCDHVTGFIDKENTIQLHWKLLKDEEMPDIALDQNYIDTLYANFKYKTYKEIHEEHRKEIKKIRTGWVIFFIWIVIIPAIYALFEYSSNLLAAVALLYSMYKAIRKGLELIGKWPKTKREKEQEKEKQLKDHYYFHCQMNPEGFNKLKLENFDKMSRDQTKKEAVTITNKSTNNIK